MANKTTSNPTIKLEKRDKRLLARHVRVSNDTRKTGLNNNDMIVGPTGSGKTRGYVMPLLAESTESMIISDTKGNLYDKYSSALSARGYKVIKLDLVQGKDSAAYNPMDFIRYDQSSRRYNENDIRTLTGMLLPTPEASTDPFWTDSARIVLESLIAYTFEATPADSHHFGTVIELFKAWDPDIYSKLFSELEALDPESFAASRFAMYKNIWKADRTAACIRQFVAQALSCFDGIQTGKIFFKRTGFSFREMGNRKTALFLNISDTDHSRDSLVNIFYSQALHQLILTADSSPDSHLKVPVRIIFDDFAAGTMIPNFDKIISVIRSREISVSLILQSISQLESLYSHSKAMTIINNCDHLLYLGGTDVGTADYISTKADVRSATILNLSLTDCLLFERGYENGVLHVERADIDDLTEEAHFNCDIDDQK